MPVFSLKKKKPTQTQGRASGYRMAARNGCGEIYLYGVIGDSWFSDGVTASQFATDLKALGNVSAIDLRINSEGGDVFQGRTMYTLLNDHPAKVTVYVDGLAASIASLIAMAGDEIVMGEGTFMMIHNPWSVVMGDSNEIRRMADLLDTIGSSMVATYAARTNAKEADIIAWLNAETWMTAQDALDRGFADKIIEPMKVAAGVHLPMAYKNLPASLRPNRAAAIAAIQRITGASKKS